jgi:hypothetical protein
MLGMVEDAEEEAAAGAAESSQGDGPEPKSLREEGQGNQHKIVYSSRLIWDQRSHSELVRF